MSLRTVVSALARRRETLAVFLCGMLAAFTFVSLLFSATTDRAMIRVAFACAALAETGALFVLWLRTLR